MGILHSWFAVSVALAGSFLSACSSHDGAAEGPAGGKEVGGSSGKESSPGVGGSGGPKGPTDDDASSGSVGEALPVGGFHPELFEKCALPVIYVNDKPNDPRLKELEAKLGGPAGVRARLELIPKMACAILYKTPDAVPDGVPSQVRIVMNVSQTRWPSGSEWTDPATGKKYGDYPAGDMESISSDGDVLIAAFGTIQHEVDHICTPPGGARPKWIEETLADYVRYKAGYTAESVRAESQQQHYCNGYNAGSYFFEWIESQHPGFIYNLDQWLTDHKDGPWPGGYPANGSNSEQVFKEVTGTGLKALWAGYTKSLGGINPPINCGADMWMP